MTGFLLWKVRRYRRIACLGGGHLLVFCQRSSGPVSTLDMPGHYSHTARSEFSNWELTMDGNKNQYYLYNFRLCE